jgi:hypothetical protein
MERRPSPTLAMLIGVPARDLPAPVVRSECQGGASGALEPVPSWLDRLARLLARERAAGEAALAPSGITPAHHRRVCVKGPLRSRPSA